MPIISRRHLLAGSAAVAGLQLLPAGTAEAQSRRILVLASQIDVPNFDPHVATGYAPSMFLRNTYDSLVRVEGNPPQPVPHLATSWEVSGDGREYVFKLDPTARFHDGSPVDAAAVKYSFARLTRLKKGNSWMVSGIVDESSVEVVDPTTVRIRLIKPFVAFLQTLPWVWIVNPAVVEANKGDDDAQAYLASNLAGSGAFTIPRAESGNLYEFARVADGWRQGGGNLDGAIWKIVRETSSQRLMVGRREVHFALDLQSEDMDALRDRPGVVPVIEPQYRTFTFKMNTSSGPLADINLRRAISHAFDYESMLTLAGYAKLLTGPLPDGLFGHEPSLEVPRTDLDKAQEYLARSDAAGKRLTLSMAMVSGFEIQRKLGLVLLDSLRKLGLELEIRPMIWPDMVASVRSPETAPDFFPVYQTANYADPDNVAFAAYHSMQNGNWQNPYYSNPRIDQLIEAARAETDEARRRQLYLDFQKQVVEDAPDIFGFIDMHKLALTDDVQNYFFTPVAPNAIELFPLSLA